MDDLRCYLDWNIPERGKCKLLIILAEMPRPDGPWASFLQELSNGHYLVSAFFHHVDTPLELLAWQRYPYLMQEEVEMPWLAIETFHRRFLVVPREEVGKSEQKQKRDREASIQNQVVSGDIDLLLHPQVELNSAF